MLGEMAKGNNAHTERIIFRLFVGLFVLQRPLAEGKFKAKNQIFNDHLSR